jgi:hypothetical protein
MPNVPVDDILIHPRDNDLIVGTHGRSIWVLDNISSLEALTPDAIRNDAFLVPPARARLLSIYNPQAWYGAGQYFAPNPDFGAALEYYLRSGSNDDARVMVADAHGTPVRMIQGTGHAGVNRVSWDLRMEPPVPDGTRNAPAAGGFGGAPQGPLVLPDVYLITTTIGGRVLKGELHVEGDPRVTFPDADRRTRQTALLNLYALQKSLADLVAQSNAINSLSRAIEGYSGLPTADQYRQLDWAFEDAAKAVEALNRMLQTDTAPPRLTVPAKLTKNR